MAKELKTQKNKKSVSKFLESVEKESKREDTEKIVKIMKEISGKKPYMWGDSLIGFGSFRYTRADGSEHEWFQIGVAPRKANITLHLMGLAYNMDEVKELKELGKHKTGKGCLYINKLSDVDENVLRDVIKKAWEGEFSLS